MATKLEFQLIPLDRMARPPFDLSQLPFSLMSGVEVADVSALLPPSRFTYLTAEVGRYRMRFYDDTVKHAIVHRYDEDPTEFTDWEELAQYRKRKADLINEVFVCSRIVRPTRRLGSVGCTLSTDQTLSMGRTTFPDNALDVPEGQKLFAFRNQDLEELRDLLPAFLTAIHGEYWPFRMAVQYYDLGYEVNEWRGRFLYWGSSALHALYSSNSNSLIRRIRAFLGESTRIYNPPDHPELEFFQEPILLTVGDVLEDINTVRHCIAHGDKIPDSFFRPDRSGLNGTVNRIGVLDDALGFIMKETLKKILRGDISHFATPRTVSQFWKAQGL
jgi:hypothetical protein